MIATLVNAAAVLAGAIALPLLAAFVYVAGALLAKRASEFRVGIWRTAFLGNVIAASIFALLLPFGGTVHPDQLWQPALVAVFYLLGQLDRKSTRLNSSH